MAEYLISIHPSTPSHPIPSLSEKGNPTQAPQHSTDFLQPVHISLFDSPLLYTPAP